MNDDFKVITIREILNQIVSLLLSDPDVARQIPFASTIVGELNRRLYGISVETQVRLYDVVSKAINDSEKLMKVVGSE